MTTLEIRETTQPPAGQQLEGRVALVTGGARGGRHGDWSPAR
jgi:hypothetical protein